MAATQSGDVGFSPKVWSDHITAYFDRKMAVGAFALDDRTLTASPGETVNFPFYKKIGDAEEPAEDQGITIDPLKDDAFSVTVKEIAKGVGWKDKARRVSAANKQGIDPNDEQRQEAMSQIGRVFAEKVDRDLIATMNETGNHVAGFVGSSSSHTANIRDLLRSKVTGFGDKQDQAIACFMHSQDFISMMTDSNAGFLKADATDPLYGIGGFQGRVLGMALFTLDTMPEVQGGIDSKKAWYHFIIKENPYGIYMAEDMSPEEDRDIIHRESLLTATMWYGTLALHSKVSTEDLRITRGAFASELDA